MNNRTVLKVNGEKQTTGHCPSCGKRTVLHGGAVNVRSGVKVWKTKCACGEAWRLTPLAWYKAAMIGGKLVGLLLCMAAVCGAAPIPDATNSLALYDMKIVSELETNWTSAGQNRTLLWWNGEGQDPNVTTYHERGTVSSNTFAVVSIGDKSGRVRLDTEYLGTAHRSYTIETRRVYGTTTFRSERWERPLTNAWRLTNFGEVYTITNITITNLNPALFPSR